MEKQMLGAWLFGHGLTTTQRPVISFKEIWRVHVDSKRWAEGIAKKGLMDRLEHISKFKCRTCSSHYTTLDFKMPVLKRQQCRTWITVDVWTACIACDKPCRLLIVKT